MKEVRQTKMPELSPVKPAVVTERRKDINSVKMRDASLRSE